MLRQIRTNNMRCKTIDPNESRILSTNQLYGNMRNALDIYLFLWLKSVGDINICFIF